MAGGVAKTRQRRRQAQALDNTNSGGRHGDGGDEIDLWQTRENHEAAVAERLKESQEGQEEGYKSFAQTLLEATL